MRGEDEGEEMHGDVRATRCKEVHGDAWRCKEVHGDTWMHLRRCKERPHAHLELVNLA